MSGKRKWIIFVCALAFMGLAIWGWKISPKNGGEPIVVKDDSLKQLEGEGADWAEEDEPEESIGQIQEVSSQQQDAQAKATVESQDNKGASKQVETKDEPKKSASSSFKIVDRLASWGYEKASDRKIDTIILHSTYNAIGGDEFDLDKIIGIYKSYGVAPHYIVARDAKVYRTVEDKNIAYHAGESKMPDGRTGVNSFSIGIEIINSKAKGPTSVQYDSLKKLLSYLKGKHSIKHTLGHSDIAPGRKEDPWKFEWEKVK